MNLVVQPPILPMLAKRVDEIPAAANWIYEPKWDGFRCLVFRSGDEILLQSRDEKSLNRYFPELLPPLLHQLPGQCVLDGEIVIADGGALNFDALQLRIHPASSRVRMLSEQTAASMVFFDVLCLGDRDLRGEPFSARRAALEEVLRSAGAPLHKTPATTDPATAQDWFRRFEGAGLDGVMAKPMEGAYEPNKRAMLKIKHERDCDCVVAGFRWYRKSDQPAIGSILLGLYDEARNLQHVGVCGSFPAEQRIEMVSFLEPWRHNAALHHPWLEPATTAEGPQSLHRIPGGQSRWSRGKDLAWEPLRPELVAEVAYEHMQRGRFRHMAQFRRWRFDKPPDACTFDQLEVVPAQELSDVFDSRRK